MEAKQKREGQWITYFDGSAAKIEYEALLLGLHALKYLGAQKIRVLGDSELVINQVNESYQTRHPRMRAYRNEVWDMIGNFFTEHTIQVVSRHENTIADSLEVAAGKFKTPIAGQKEYQVDIVNRPSIPDNSKYWQVFEDDMQIRRFLELSGEFVNTHINTENDNGETFQDDEEPEREKEGTKKLKRTLGRKGYYSIKK